MIAPFFALAAQSPGRQESFRSTVTAHLLMLGACALYVNQRGAYAAPIVGHALLIAGIIEGAILIGWRLTQLPKSLALEFLLVSQLSPRLLLVSEALVGLARLALVTLTGLPLLVYLTTINHHGSAPAFELLPPQFLLIDILPLLVIPFTWGAITGLGLATWAFEGRAVRRTLERCMLALLLVYLVAGVLAGNKLFEWLELLQNGLGGHLAAGLWMFHLNTPFAQLAAWLSDHKKAVFENMLILEAAGVTGVGLMLLRAALRLKPHFDELHYRPAVDESRGPRGEPGDRPLSWWAVRRVTEYSGRINLWLAAGFGILYALYTVAGPAWPSWMGKGVFLIVENVGGIPGLASALVILSAVPAAFQYGLWDSNIQDRCRRLELLLLTQLDVHDYWHAAARAAWHRGRGYIAVAVLLWASAVLAGQASILSMLAAVISATILWWLYFILGFRAFTRGIQANGSGMLLTVGLPLLTFVLFRAHLPELGVLLPPATVYAPMAGLPPLYWLPGPLLAGLAAVLLARRTLAESDTALRKWYERYHGQKVSV